MCIALGKINKKLCACQFLSGRQTDTFCFSISKFEKFPVNSRNICVPELFLFFAPPRKVSQFAADLFVWLFVGYLCASVCVVFAYVRNRARVYMCVFVCIYGVIVRRAHTESILFAVANGIISQFRWRLELELSEWELMRLRRCFFHHRQSHVYRVSEDRKL